MSIPLAIVIILLASLAMGVLIRLQWLPKDDTPPPKPLPQWAAVLIAVGLTAIFVAMTTFAVLDFVARQV